MVYGRKAGAGKLRFRHFYIWRCYGRAVRRCNGHACHAARLLATPANAGHARLVRRCSPRCSPWQSSACLTPATLLALPTPDAACSPRWPASKRIISRKVEISVERVRWHGWTYVPALPAASLQAAAWQPMPIYGSNVFSDCHFAQFIT